MNLSWMEGTEKLPHFPSFCSSFRYCHYPLRIRFPVAAGSREAGVSSFSLVYLKGCNVRTLSVLMPLALSASSL